MGGVFQHEREGENTRELSFGFCDYLECSTDVNRDL